MNVAVVDDRTEEREKLKRLLAEYAAESGTELRVSGFPDAESFLESYQPYLYTVIFLDIYLDGMTGLDCAEQIRRIDRDSALVFLTTSEEHRADAFSVHAFDYLCKPVGRDRLFRMMDEVLRRDADSQSLCFNGGHGEVRLNYGDVVSVSSDGHYLEIRSGGGEVYKTRMLFSAAQELLCRDARFLPILRGVLVNMDYIRGFDKGVCRLDDGVSLPLNLRSQKALEQRWQNYLFARLRREAMEKTGRR